MSLQEEWASRADETNSYLINFDRYIWPIYQQHGYTDKALALLAFNLGPMDDEDDDTEGDGYVSGN